MTPFCTLAQATSVAFQSTTGPAMLNQLVLFVFVVVVFYLLMVRPQQKKHREHQRLLQDLKAGSKVLTNSGIHGLIANVKDKTVVLKVADNVKIEFEKSSIIAVVDTTAGQASQGKIPD
ncbi:MAG: preprotein translocase subunit YajC [Candidatus Xiphinematobacter sp.]|nr:MAG: preprotein translocase subunit YajC [Candidatus Xiphinematobacter sp.]QQY09794.1 MAG: preprotein translocase subunit YajC [Candidatus Xiphinematobacter sp.]QQY10536.1 MAG: preprotein translocase subunit YajC [Candidatus Xiphinematobacter sp.]